MLCCKTVHETSDRLSFLVGAGKSHPSSLHSTKVASVVVFFCLLGVCLLSKFSSSRSARGRLPLLGLSVFVSTMPNSAVVPRLWPLPLISVPSSSTSICSSASDWSLTFFLLFAFRAGLGDGINSVLCLTAHSISMILDHAPQRKGSQRLFFAYDILQRKT